MFLNLARVILAALRRLRNLIKRLEMVGRNVNIDRTVSISWSVSMDPARGQIDIGKNSVLDKGVILRSYGGFIRIGSHCTVNPYCVLYGGGGLTIGNRVLIAAQVVMVPSNHIYADPEKSISEQGLRCKGIVIEDDVWIGAGAKILDGVTISKGCVIAAGAVVTKSSEPYAILAGVPAKKIASRIAT